LSIESILLVCHSECNEESLKVIPAEEPESMLSHWASLPWAESKGRSVEEWQRYLA